MPVTFSEQGSSTPPLRRSPRLASALRGSRRPTPPRRARTPTPLSSESPSESTKSNPPLAGRRTKRRKTRGRGTKRRKTRGRGTKRRGTKHRGTKHRGRK